MVPRASASKVQPHRARDALLSEGAIVATGERRWRKYQLADDKRQRP
jgi:hypothetical protein